MDRKFLFSKLFILLKVTSKQSVFIEFEFNLNQIQNEFKLRQNQF